MKELKFFALLICLAVFTLPAMANSSTEPVDGKLIFKTTVEGESVIYQLSNLQKLDTKVAIYSMDGDVRYYKDFITDHNGYVTRLNLKKLPEGKYKMVVENESDSVVKVLKIEENRILFSK